ncbi:tail protein X [Lysobacter arvi]|uniref:Tail protein X n=1 Tax=Lysobacter arvi TaxID=3038776 RepID=A0ABU1CBB0_9GAMM|nr:tail protein X [Lysobacter arvi]MDR0182400.1 tail protein X [Lysobacter arvi]
MRVFANQGDTLDLLCWRHLGETDGVVEAALALNPGLAELGAVLPIGTPVDLPDLAPSAPLSADLIQLWD